jgi:AmmeMemoRadiSam system protein B
MKALTRVVLLLAICAALLGAQTVVRILQPIAAGVWYPADPKVLSSQVDKLTTESDISTPGGHIVACIVPHAPYSTSGAIAGAAFKNLEPGVYDRVVMLATAHHTKFRGCSIPSVTAIRTPLGDVMLDGPTIRKLTLSPLIEVRSVQYKQHMARKLVHERECKMEVILPFLQRRLGHFLLIPVLFGEFKTVGGKFDGHAVDAVARDLGELVDDRTLFVVCTNFTHFGNRFSYRPFREQIIEGIDMLDQAAFRLILTRDSKEFARYLDETRNTIDGQDPLRVLLKILPRNAKGTLLAHDISARRTGDTKTSISYASLIFTTPAKNPE